jgi:predicted dehydrogenase
LPELGIIMNGVTGRMGTNQHLLRSLVAIIEEGGVELSDGTRVMPKLMLVGRNPDKLKALSEKAFGAPWSTSLDEVLNDPSYSVYFDAQTTLRRVDAVKKAVAAGKHVYCEKPTAVSTQEAYDLYVEAHNAGVKHGVVQDKLWLPGMLKIKALTDSGFFGRILSVRGEFGYWVFEGDRREAQRPSWNYREEDGGGIILDMLCHWRYVLDNLFGEVEAVSCLGATHIPTRWDENNEPYECTADDSAYATFALDKGIVAHFNSSWTVRVRRDDLLTLQVDGTEGTAVVGLRDCWIQDYNDTPRPVWNPDVPSPIDFREGWQPFMADQTFDNAFKQQWELFIRHVVSDEPFRWDLLEGAKGVQLAEVGLKSWSERRWMDLPDLPRIV